MILRPFTKRISLTFKMIFLTVCVGTAVWMVLDYYLSREVRKVFSAQLEAEFQNRSLEDRLRFERYLNAHYQLARICVAQEKYFAYLDEKEWFSSLDDEVTYHFRTPSWYVPNSVLRSLAAPRYAVLLDGRGRAREIYQATRETVPPALLEPGSLLMGKSEGQTLLTTVDSLPFLTSVETVDGPGGQRVSLMLASPLDDEFLLASQGDYSGNMIGLVSDVEPVVLVSNKPEIIAPGTLLEEIEKDYLVTGRTFHDYGGAEFVVKFTSFVSTAKMKMMTASFVDQGRRQRAAIAVAIILSSVFVMVLVTRRVSRLNRRVERFSREALGGGTKFPGGGDKLDLLEDRFHLLTGEVVRSQERIKEESEKKVRERAEKEHKERLFNLFHSATDAIGVGVLSREEGRLTARNRQMEHFVDLFGNTTVFDLPPGLSENRYMVDLHGVEHIYLLTARGFPAGEEVVLVQDVTRSKKAEESLRESEEKYRSLFEDSRDAIYVTMRDGTMVEANQATLDLFGYEREELIGANALILYVFPDDRMKFRQKIEENSSVRDYTMKFRRKDGTVLNALVTAAVRRDPQGKITSYQGIIRDDTKRREVEKELMRVEKLESVGILAGGIAHDFNNILQAILTNISIAMMLTPSEGELRQRLIEAENATQRATDLTIQLLTFSRGGAPVKRPTPISELIRESVNFALRGTGVSSLFDIPAGLWQAEVDEGQIVQVLNNLIINAQQAMPEGGVISVTAENTVVREDPTLPLEDGRYVKISIRDQGEGIPGENLGKIFDPFFSTKDEGSGLGLAVVYSIMKNHDGFVQLDSSPGEGTTATVHLPATAWNVPSSRKPGDEGLGVPAGARVLLLDDEAAVRESTGNVLKFLGCEVSTASDGAEAVRKYKDSLDLEQPYDVVILDLTIPGGMSGKEAIGQILALNREAKAIVSSGYSNDPVMADYRKYGFAGVLAKPYTTNDLNRTLRGVLSLK